MLPKDPFILLSFIHTKLRDEYGNFEELCTALDVEGNTICEALESLDYHYDSVHNQFI